MNDCVLWKGAKDSNGYGQSWKYGKPFKAHRDSYEKANNIKLSSTDFILHKCDTPSCINPEHLFIGTQLDNMRDKINKGRDKYSFGEAHYNSKLKETDIIYIKNSSKKNKDLAIELQVDASHISRIRRGERWKNVKISD